MFYAYCHLEWNCGQSLKTIFGLLDYQIFTVQHPCMYTFQNVYYYDDHFPKEIFALIEVKSNVFSVPLKKKIMDRDCLFWQFQKGKYWYIPARVIFLLEVKDP